MPGRSYSANSEYRYGFNGQEKSDEIDPNGNLMTAMFWEYDSRIGRRWNVDPKPTVGISVYSAFNNNPIWFTDALGDKPKIKIKSAVYSDNGKTQTAKSDIEVFVNIKVLDLTGKGANLTKSLAGEYWQLDGSKGSVVDYAVYKHDGTQFKKDKKRGGYRSVTVTGTIQVRYNIQIITSVKQIEAGDNVLLIGENVKDRGAKVNGVTTSSYVSIMDIDGSKNLDDLRQTAIHEITHQMGLSDEYYYNGSSPIPRSRYPDNLMDLKGWKLTDEQRGKLILHFLDSEGRSKNGEPLFNSQAEARNVISKKSDSKEK